jgi:adenylate kinase family enzyme
MRRILIVGSSGTGKSTVARAIGARLGLPVIHLDNHYWRPGWVPSDDADFDARVAALAAADRRVIDGQYSRTWDLRVGRADMIVWLDLPRRVYFWRVLKRTLRGRGRVRPDLGEGCPERLDLAFPHNVWDYPRRSRGRMIVRLQQSPGARRVVILKSQRQIDAFVAGLVPATASRV